MKVTFYDGAGPASVEFGPLVAPGKSLPVGQPGQVVTFDSDGGFIAADAPPASLPPGEVGDVVGYDQNGLAIAVKITGVTLSRNDW